MPNYIHKKLVAWRHQAPKQQYFPNKPSSIMCCKQFDIILCRHVLSLLDKKGRGHAQQVHIRCLLLFYGHAIYIVLLCALFTIISEQDSCNEHTLYCVKQILHYMASNSNAIIRFCASIVILNFHSSDNPHVSEGKEQSWVEGHFSS